MEQREAIPDGAMELSFGTIQAGRVTADRPSLTKANADAFCAALGEARRAQYGGEIKRAHYYCQQALEAVPEDVEAEKLADIFERLNDDD